MTSEMEALIEKVARLAGWERITSMLNPKRFTWVERVEGIKPDFATEEGLNADGLRILLDELLRAGWQITFEETISIAKGTDIVYKQFYLVDWRMKSRPRYADTLEEAVMLAYVSMKEAA